MLVQVKASFQLGRLHKTGKKESMQRLLAELKEDLDIITLQIKKGQHILEKLRV